MTMNLGSLMQAMKIQTPGFWIRSYAFPNFFIELQRASLELEVMESKWQVKILEIFIENHRQGSPFRLCRRGFEY